MCEIKFSKIIMYVTKLAISQFHWILKLCDFWQLLVVTKKKTNDDFKKINQINYHPFSIYNGMHVSYYHIKIYYLQKKIVL